MLAIIPIIQKTTFYALSITKFALPSSKHKLTKSGLHLHLISECFGYNRNIFRSKEFRGIKQRTLGCCS